MRKPRLLDRVASGRVALNSVYPFHCTPIVQERQRPFARKLGNFQWARGRPGQGREGSSSGGRHGQDSRLYLSLAPQLADCLSPGDRGSLTGPGEAILGGSGGEACGDGRVSVNRTSVKRTRSGYCPPLRSATLARSLPRPAAVQPCLNFRFSQPIQTRSPVNEVAVACGSTPVNCTLCVESCEERTPRGSNRVWTQLRGSNCVDRTRRNQ